MDVGRSSTCGHEHVSSWSLVQIRSDVTGCPLLALLPALRILLRLLLNLNRSVLLHVRPNLATSKHIFRDIGPLLIDRLVGLLGVQVLEPIV